MTPSTTNTAAREFRQRACPGCGMPIYSDGLCLSCEVDAEPSLTQQQGGEQGAVAWCSLTPSGKIGFFDGKPMVMVGPVGNEHHPDPLYTAPSTQRAAGGGIAWESTTQAYIRYITDARYQKFSAEVRRWYKPYRCTSCTTPPRHPADEGVARKYEELIYAVGNKYPGESRHETALRYICQAETPSNAAAQSDKAGTP